MYEEFKTFTDIAAVIAVLTCHPFIVKVCG